MAPRRKFNWIRFFNKLYKRSFEADLTGGAAQVAFYFSFALFPLLYFLISLFGMILESSDGVRRELLAYLDQVMPYAVFKLVSSVIDEIITNSTGWKAFFGLAVALWSASAGVDALRTSLNMVYGLKESRTWWWTKVQSLIYTFAITILVAIVLAAVFYGWQLVKLGVDAAGFEITSPLVLILIQWITTLVVLLFACEIIYNLIPNFKELRWIWITYGSLVAIALWLILTTGFRLYLGYFNTYDKAYGSLGAVIIMMLWLYLTALALMVGGAINAVLRDMGHSPSEF